MTVWSERKSCVPIARFVIPLAAERLRPLVESLRGDSVRSLTLGVNLRPIPETCFKLAYTRGERRDRFNNLGSFASWVLGIASYF